MDRNEISRVFREDRRKLFLIAVAITANSSLAEDCIQEAIVGVIRSASRPLNLSAYVATAVRNEAFRQARRSARLPPSAQTWLEPVDPAPALEDRQAARELCGLLSRLEPETREAIVLHLNAGMTFREIALHTGQSINTVASRYRRGLSKIRNQVTSHEQHGRQAAPL